MGFGPPRTPSADQPRFSAKLHSLGSLVGIRIYQLILDPWTGGSACRSGSDPQGSEDSRFAVSFAGSRPAHPTRCPTAPPSRLVEIRSAPPGCFRGSSPTAPRLTDREPNTCGSRWPVGGSASRVVPPTGPALRFPSASQCPAQSRGTRNRPERIEAASLTEIPGAARARRLRSLRARSRRGHPLRTIALSGHRILRYRSGVS